MLVCLLTMAGVARAQLRAAADTIRFGLIAETDGPASQRAYVVNDGKKPLRLERVSPTCGCTAVSFMKEEILPGDSAWIDLTYNPYRRPGHFEKAVKVYPSEGEMIRLPIEGTVKASPETLDNMYPATVGRLRTSETLLMPAGVLAQKERTVYIDVYNAGDQDATVSITEDYPAIEWQSFPAVIPPYNKGIVGIYINPAKEERRGDLEYEMLINDGEGDGSAELNSLPVKILIKYP